MADFSCCRVNYVTKFKGIIFKVAVVFLCGTYKTSVKKNSFIWILAMFVLLLSLKHFNP